MKNQIVVNPEFRVNPLSLTPGGSTVTVIEQDGTELVYSNVKNPQAYIDRVLKNNPDVKGFLVNHKPVDRV